MSNKVLVEKFTHNNKPKDLNTIVKNLNTTLLNKSIVLCESDKDEIMIIYTENIPSIQEVFTGFVIKNNTGNIGPPLIKKLEDFINANQVSQVFLLDGCVIIRHQ